MNRPSSSRLAQGTRLQSGDRHRASCATRIGIIIPACNEEACIARVLEEILAVIDPAKLLIAVGVNDSSDRTAEIARSFPVLVAETATRGYGHGCQAAINALQQAHPDVDGYLFMAADGASDPADLNSLLAPYEQGFGMVLGARTGRMGNWQAMSLPHVLANFSLGLCCGLLTGRRFTDLAPLRLIERRLYEAIAPREMTFGWTIEAQVGAAILGASICEVPGRERPRLAGEQKVSGVSWQRTFSIGCRILAAGWRAQRRFARQARRERATCAPDLVPQSQPGV